MAQENSAGVRTRGFFNATPGHPLGNVPGGLDEFAGIFMGTTVMTVVALAVWWHS